MFLRSDNQQSTNSKACELLLSGTLSNSMKTYYITVCYPCAYTSKRIILYNCEASEDYLLDLFKPLTRYYVHVRDTMPKHWRPDTVCTFYHLKDVCTFIENVRLHKKITVTRRVETVLDTQYFDIPSNFRIDTSKEFRYTDNAYGQHTFFEIVCDSFQGAVMNPLASNGMEISVAKNGYYFKRGHWKISLIESGKLRNYYKAEMVKDEQKEETIDSEIVL